MSISYYYNAIWVVALKEIEWQKVNARLAKAQLSQKPSKLRQGDDHIWDVIKKLKKNWYLWTVDWKTNKEKEMKKSLNELPFSKGELSMGVVHIDENIPKLEDQD